MRGLKYSSFNVFFYHFYVAPYTGAWIEIYAKIGHYLNYDVAPYTGAWIEIINLALIISGALSHLTQVRGLKYVI